MCAKYGAEEKLSHVSTGGGALLVSCLREGLLTGVLVPSQERPLSFWRARSVESFSTLEAKLVLTHSRSQDLPGVKALSEK